MRLRALAAALSFCIAALSAGTAQAVCADDQVEIRGEFGSVRFRAAIADTPQERAQGLMHVESMPRMSGMLFIYERPQRVAFWMRNTLIPLDMIFADATGTVRRIHENAVPLDETPIPGGRDIQYVLEINGGLSEALGLAVGDEMRHPGLDQELAAWPCAAE